MSAGGHYDIRLQLDATIIVLAETPGGSLILLHAIYIHLHG